jgi:hypothetical protein
MTAAAVASACERDPNDSAELDEIERALRILLDDGLAEPGAIPRSDVASGCDVDLYVPTRAATRAEELRF